MAANREKTVKIAKIKKIADEKFSIELKHCKRNSFMNVKNWAQNA